MRHVAGHGVDRAKAISEPVFWILLSLAERPRHGYGLMQDVVQLSDGRVHLTTGTLYGALSRLLQDRWIERFASPDTSRDKQSYSLTRLGHTRLREETERLRHIARTATVHLKKREA